MNIKKTFIISISTLIASASVFAASKYSKAEEAEANLGRMYISLGAGANVVHYNSVDVEGLGTSETPVGGLANLTFNIPVFKPSVNAFKDISWAGFDVQLNGYFGGYSKTVAYENEDFEMVSASGTIFNYAFAISAVPYLEFDTGWDYFQSFKPFAVATVGYQWNTRTGDLPSPALSGTDSHYLIWRLGAGLEVPVTEAFSLTGLITYNSNTGKNVPQTVAVGAEATYWVNSFVGCSAFAEYDFGSSNGNTSEFVFGLRFKVAFNR